MATYLADSVIVYDGSPGIDAHANTPQPLLSGMNAFLKTLDITFRRDPTNFRPRINKYESQLDKQQKLSGNYFFLEDTPDNALQKTGKGITEETEKRKKKQKQKIQSNEDKEVSEEDDSENSSE
eukprot:NODE_908_length_3125_cov_1.360212.p2 type:complete len:124 gc:universal NODE_908_length_3125_cov_1.360212:338-709(+)